MYQTGAEHSTAGDTNQTAQTSQISAYVGVAYREQKKVDQQPVITVLLAWVIMGNKSRGVPVSKVFHLVLNNSMSPPAS